MTTLRRFIRDPFASSVTVLGVLAIVGFVAVRIAWSGAAASLVVAVQLPFIISGGFAGIGLLAFSLGLLVVQIGRREEARRHVRIERVIAAATELLEQARPLDPR